MTKKSLGKALLTEYFLGTAAGMAAGSDTVIVATCLKCGQTWSPGSLAERKLRLESGQLTDVEATRVVAEVYPGARTARQIDYQRDDEGTAIAVFTILVIAAAVVFYAMAK